MPDANTHFDRLVGEFYPVWKRYHPVEALLSGEERCTGLLPPAADDERAALQSWMENFLLCLDEVDTSALEADRQLDHALAFGQTQVEYRELLERDLRHRDPATFIPIRPLMPLLTAAPPERRAALLNRILPDLVQLLRQAQTHLVSFGRLVPRVLVRSAMEEAEGVGGYLEYLRTGGGCIHLQKQGSSLARSMDEALEAVRGYRRFLGHEVLPQAAGESGCGAARLQERLHYLYASDLPLEGLRRMLARWREEVGDAQDAEVDDAPLAPAMALVASREILVRLRESIDLLPGFPVPDRLPHVVDWSGVPLRGGLMGDDLWIGDAGRSRPALWDLCLECGPLGEYLLQRHASPAAASLPRRLHPAGGLYRAWPLFLRHRLLQAGRLPEAEARHHRRRLVLALEAARLELEVHADGLDEDAATARLQGLGLSPEDACRLLAASVREPGQALADVVGWYLLEASLEVAPAGRSPLLPRLALPGRVPVPLALRYGADLSASHLLHEGMAA